MKKNKELPTSVSIICYLIILVSAIKLLAVLVGIIITISASCMSGTLSTLFQVISYKVQRGITYYQLLYVFNFIALLISAIIMLKGYNLGRIIYIITIVSVALNNFINMTFISSIIILVIQILVLLALFRPKSNNFFNSI
jgi:hypothetical protein